MNKDIPELDNQKSIGFREYTGIAKALKDYQKEVLQLHKMPMTSDCAMEIINAEKTFRKAITKDLKDWIEINCSSCPMGYSRNNCQAKSCPFQTIDKIINTRLQQLEEILPGGIN